ncbi:MAG: O-antigen ligase family protein, partial [Candidatus Sulfotelmatobacter sp.]
MNQRRWGTEPSWRIAAGSRPRSSLAYHATVIFSLIYFVRPEDFIPGLDFFPIAKIAGGIALLALIFLVPAHQRHKLTIELKVLLLLLAHMMLCIPFAAWRGGAFDAVINKFSKGVIVGILVYMVVTSVNELRKLLAIQAGTVALVTVASVLIHHTQVGRLMGIQKGILENPNDLAINIAINFPLCVAFLLAAKGAGRKLFWVVCLTFMSWGVIATYSRSGMLAMAVSVTICLWEYGIRGKRTIVLMSAVIIAVIGMGVVIATPHYLIRIESIVRGNIEGSGDRGSLEARKILLKDSLLIMVKHPLLGVGPGNFASYTMTWGVAHNTYTGLGAETGLPGVTLFLVLMGLTLRKIKRVRELPGYQSSEDIRLWTSGLWAAMAAYVSGAMFATTEYNLFPYFMVGYVCAIYQIARVPQGTEGPQ